MREIKFRAWDKTKKKMLDAVDLQDKHLYTIWLEENLEWMQNTGLKDKDGKPIYEGDIIDLMLHIVGTKKDRCKVYFEDGGFKAKSYENEVSLSNFYTKHGKKIGNVWENPELLSF